MQLILNDIGAGEIVLILVFILIFFGAKSIPTLARTFGKTIRQVREASSDIQNEIRKSGDEMKKDLNLEGMVKDTAEDIRRPLDQYASDLEDVVKYQPPKRPANQKPLGHDPKPVNGPDVPKDSPDQPEKPEEKKTSEEQNDPEKRQPKEG